MQVYFFQNFREENFWSKQYLFGWRSKDSTIYEKYMQNVDILFQVKAIIY
jgi:hypothetical protein